MIIYDLIDLKKIRRALLYIACLVVMLYIQETLLSRISPLGVRAMPVPAFIAAIGLLREDCGVACSACSQDLCAICQALAQPCCLR